MICDTMLSFSRKYALAVAWLIPALAAGQSEPAEKNPFRREPEAFETGKQLYQQRCAVCHGQDARGSMAANLRRARTVVGAEDRALFKVIRNGIPGTEMPSQDLPQDQIWRIVTYLHGIARPGLRPPLPGDTERGAKLFIERGCRSCHMIDGKGGFRGPDLSSIGAQRTAEEIRRAVVEPDAEVAEGFRQAEVMTGDGKKISGLIKNEDTFSLQIQRKDGSFVSLPRAEIREVRRIDGSLMPRKPAAELEASELQDLLAYLDRQRRPFVPDASGFNNY